MLLATPHVHVACDLSALESHIYCEASSCSTIPSVLFLERCQGVNGKLLESILGTNWAMTPGLGREGQTTLEKKLKIYQSQEKLLGESGGEGKGPVSKQHLASVEPNLEQQPQPAPLGRPN